MINADVYLFDIDGTLLVTRDLVHWNGLHRAMLETCGVDTTIEGIAYHGKTDVAILRAALESAGGSSETFSRGLPSALRIIRREVRENAHRLVTEVCPGVAKFVAYLQRQGKLLGIASGNLEEVGWHKVAAAGLRDLFSGLEALEIAARRGLRSFSMQSNSHGNWRERLRRSALWAILQTTFVRRELLVRRSSPYVPGFFLLSSWRVLSPMLAVDPVRSC